MNKNEIVEAAFSAPPASVAALTFAGVGLNDWVMILTILWLLTQFGWFAYKRIKGMKD